MPTKDPSRIPIFIDPITEDLAPPLALYKSPRERSRCRCSECVGHDILLPRKKGKR